MEFIVLSVGEFVSFPLRSALYEEARASLLYSFTKRHSEFSVPCFISDEDPPEEDRQAQPTWR